MNETTRPVTVEVTQGDIDEAATWENLEVALKRALRRLIKPDYAIDVVGGRIDIFSLALGFEYRVFADGVFRQAESSAPSVSQIKPFTFTLDLPTAALRDSATPAQEKDDATA